MNLRRSLRAAKTWTGVDDSEGRQGGSEGEGEDEVGRKGVGEGEGVV